MLHLGVHVRAHVPGNWESREQAVVTGHVVLPGTWTPSSHVHMKPKRKRSPGAKSWSGQGVIEQARRMSDGVSFSLS